MINNSMEYICCAAIHYKEIKLLKPLAHTCINIKEGIVICGLRHPHCISVSNSLTGKRDYENGEQVQGFITSNNRFVDRYEATKIAFACGQITDRDKTYLFSEDIY